MTGFKNEKEMWASQKPSLAGKWDRYELMTPPGHPDVKGSHHFKLVYIENKVGDTRSFYALEESQLEYIDWLLRCGQEVWLCFGGTREKSLVFVQLAQPNDLRRSFYQDPMPKPTVPSFWRGPTHHVLRDLGYSYCGKRMLTPR